MQMRDENNTIHDDWILNHHWMIYCDYLFVYIIDHEF
jgi:hypothetical protein